ncbi:hypothetical protein GCM10028807_58180 [Spirosoma daeguense]
MDGSRSFAIFYEQNLEAEEILYVSHTEGLRARLKDLLTLYSKSYSPLKTGDQIEYTPSGATMPGIVQIQLANCVEVPDKWAYETIIIDCPQTSQIGKRLTIWINRSETPKKLN